MLLTAALALTLVSGCAQPKPSLLLVTLDTTRADHVGAYGAAGVATPNLDALAAQGLRLEHAYATVPLTIPSHSSMMTGLYPPRHGVRSNGDAVLAPGFETLAEHLRAAGYRTGASVGAFVTTRIWGFDQGFDAYYDAVPPRATSPAQWSLQRTADQVVDDALAWLSAGQGPYFLWVHLYDAHEPYAPPEPYATRFAARPYDGELAFIDAQLGRLLPAAEAAAGPGGLNVLAVGDHGESLGEVPGERAHGTFVSEATTRVPLLLRPARALHAALVESELVASVADVLPTALGLLGLPIPTGLDGVDLSLLLRGERPPRAGVYLESYAPAQRFGYHPEIAWIELPFKLLDTPTVRLWDLRADPAETRDLAASHPRDVERLRAALAPHRQDPAPTGGVSPELTAQLAALGYVGGGFAASELDLRDHIATLQALERVQALLGSPGEDHPAEAEAILRQLLASEPQLREARFDLARLLERHGDVAGAEAIYVAAIAEQPDITTVRMAYAELLGRAGRFDEALAQARAVLAAVPRDETARTRALQLLAAANRDDELLALAASWREDGSLTPAAAAPYGLALLRSGSPESPEILRLSLTDGVARPRVQQGLASLALQEGDTVAAIELLRAELDGWPEAADARAMLARALMESGEWEEAASEYRFLAESEPDVVLWRLGWAQAVFNLADYDLAAEALAPALVRAPEDPQVLMLQANILGRQGHMDEGAAMAKRANELAKQAASSEP